MIKAYDEYIFLVFHNLSFLVQADIYRKRSKNESN
ncbi:MAG: hypothetical protein ACI93N_001602 [Flavobacteriaceae bacterium]